MNEHTETGRWWLATEQAAANAVGINAYETAPEYFEPAPCPGNHDGPCEIVNVRYQVSDDGRSSRIIVQDGDSYVYLGWETDSTESRGRLQAIVDALPTTLSNLADKVQQRKTEIQLADDVEKFLQEKTDGPPTTEE